jgi:hypothetical protein
VNNSTAPEPHPSTDETPHACLEREAEACLCYDGWVFLGRVVESEHDLDGEIVEYIRVPCRRCASEAGR